MNCPVDNAELRMTERQGIEIDYCPTCRGVWLDRGELDKIVERSALVSERADRDHDDDRDDQVYRDRNVRHDRGAAPTHRKKRKSFLGELFDID